jgi:hypothetical protein
LKEFLNGAKQQKAEPAITEKKETITATPEVLSNKVITDVKNITTCLNCSPSSLNSGGTVTSNNKRDDVTTRNYSCKIPMDEFLELQCNANLCSFGGRCVQKTTIEELATLREKLWGCLNADAPTASDRKKFIDEILRASFVKHDESFKFIVGGVPGNYNLVCEAGYLILLGLSRNRNASQSTYQWKAAKNRILGKTIETFTPKLHKTEKLDSATAYITYITSKLADTSPFAGNK